MDSILLRPLDYLHPQRLSSPAILDTPEVRVVLNRVLNARLSGTLSGGYSDHLSSKARLWVRHWSLLPSIAELLGAHFQWASLARGAMLQQLSDRQRAFARIVCDPRVAVEMEPGVSVIEHVQAVGLNALMAWSIEMPAVLIERLCLQFLPSVVDLQRRMPAQHLNPTLFFLAVQHARIHQNAG
ncbi:MULTISPECIES: hypothetical protein [unclassified Pseudomonas]|uniref:hypothetical protein n=1 Tax=unclassified Pseudomonas TaxID=196821 RepID=UPI001314E20E|nr:MULTISPECIES: hypothetical protein [unclassified Pseudomonas]